ncbi:cys-loop ligand-gated ion channel-like isoform X2 [Ostrea edulis]|uniref:cys-loop ligand-gated ion channel-like isoform X2 n=1 Tax=Ostrea edulis TaxID=37623 RepID=UPI0020946BB6|nr:cys-loop ligand-gated ion channel-like isoform X2 [Ostrea edulis]
MASNVDFILKKKALIKVVFLKVGEIDTLKEFFVADVFVQIRWREPALDKPTERQRVKDVLTGALRTLTQSHIEISKRKSDEIQLEKYWDPKIVFQNILSETMHSEWKLLKHNDDGEAFIVQKHRLKATFSENLELALFPFDIQDLTLIISTELSEAEVELVEDIEEISSVQIDSFAKEQEWTLHECVSITPKVTTKAYTNPQYKNPAVVAGCFAGRRAGFFIWNVMLIMTLISSLSLATFAVDRALPQNRLQLSFTLVLTGVAFKFVANQSIPKISYLTHLDRYILGSMIFLYLVCIWHAVVTLTGDQATSREADKDAFIVFSSCFACLQVLFIVSVVISGYHRYSNVKQIERRYQERAHRKLALEKSPVIQTAKVSSMSV